MELYKAIGEFAVETALGLLSFSYTNFGASTYCNGMLPAIIAGIVEEHFNNCIAHSRSREVESLNAHFDKMMAAAQGLHEKHGNDPYEIIDLLHLSVRLTMQLITRIERKDAGGYEKTMIDAKEQMMRLVEQFSSFANTFKGRTEEPADSIAIKFEKTRLENGQLKIEDDWLEDCQI